MTISVNPYGGVFGVRRIGSYSGDADLSGMTRRYDVKEVSFNPDKVQNKKSLKWNDTSVVREYQYGPKSLTPRFGCEGEFYLTTRLHDNKALVGKMNAAGEIVQLEKCDLDAIKDMRKSFPYVERFLKKISKYVVC